MTKYNLYGRVILMYDHAASHCGYFLSKSGLNQYRNNIVQLLDNSIYSLDKSLRKVKLVQSITGYDRIFGSVV